MSDTAMWLKYLSGALVSSAFAALGWYRLHYVGREKRPVRVLITGASGQVGYALAPMIARGDMLRPDTPVILHLYDVPPCEGPLHGLRMELMDLANPTLEGVLATVDLEEACVNVDFVIMLGGCVRRQGMDRKEWIAENVRIYREQGAALDRWASPDVKVVVVASPANTNAWVLRQSAPSILPHNITALTRLDHNRALAEVAQRLSISVRLVKNVIIWGNHTSTKFPDASHGTAAGRPIIDALGKEYVMRDFVAAVLQRGSTILRVRNLSSAMSAASAVCDHVREWVRGTPRGQWTSMAVFSEGPAYGIPSGLCFSFPVQCHKGCWSVVSGLQLSEEARARIQRSAADLAEDRELARECLEGT